MLKTPFSILMRFLRSSLFFISGSYDDTNVSHQEELAKYVSDNRKFTNNTSKVQSYSGNLVILDGALKDNELTIFHNNSIAESVYFLASGECKEKDRDEEKSRDLFNGQIETNKEGKIKPSSVKCNAPFYYPITSYR